MSYTASAWKRLGAAVQDARMEAGMSTTVLGYAINSSSKSVMRLEQGRVFGIRSEAPAADYNSEKYVLRRLVLLDRALGWEPGTAAAILDPMNALPKQRARKN